MKTKILKFFLFCLIILPLNSCGYKEKYEKTNSELKECKKIIDKKTTQDILLEHLEKLEIPKKYDNTFKDTLIFNLDVSYKGTQIVHLSSDYEKIPFMLVSKVQGKKIKGDKFRISSFKIGIRSIGESAATYFKIVGRPTMKKYTKSKDFDYILEANIDLNETNGTRGSNKDVEFGIKKTIEVQKGETIEVEINPKKLKNALILLYKENPSFNNEQILNKIDNLCCGGVICQLRIVY